MAVYKRGAKGVFYMNFTVNGTRIFRSTGKFTKKEAKLVEAVEKRKLMEEAALSPREKASRLRLSEAIQQVYDERWKHNKDGEKSFRNASRLVALIGDIPISRIDEDVVRKLVKSLESTGVEVATVNRYLASLKTLLRHHRQLWDHVKLKKERNGRIRVLTRGEETKLVALLRDMPSVGKRSYYPQVAELVELLVDTGCRLSEILHLKYKDVNFDTNLISIWINKGDRPRSIPMTARVRRILLGRREMNLDRPFALNVYQAERAWNYARRQMGLEEDKEFVLHALRHTCATRLIDKGIDLYTVKEWLGHSTIQVTEKYAHLNPKKLAHAASVLEL
ncbi:tyrosine-type recombinase/integrase [Geobacter sulfurreducens]|uniref:tyrosine-type recombinase/integrase n=1 Tax=Geobacter sulfurreducens TaxID=35554 RepID=UPI000DBB6038|nr:site-specific integrase [Geobacter sulfurreducens]BBA71023.1 Tyrosine recombinase XerD [Geobacter sulfurreducens]